MRGAFVRYNHFLLLYKLRFLFAGILLIVGLFLLSTLLTSIAAHTVEAKDTKSSANVLTTDMSSSPNVISSGMAKATVGLGQTTESTLQTINSGILSAASATNNLGKQIARNAQTGIVATARGVGSGLAFVGRTVGKGVGFVVSIPGKLVGSVANTQVVNNFIRPADHVEVPIIDPNSPELAAALTALPATTETTRKGTKKGSTPVWPMHGTVTTEFGVGHWPYQHVHSGIDISDALAPGITPIRPFRPGKVIDTVFTSGGLGNHVIIDHGNGVTSVYAHLSSISVHVGQEVTTNDTLGLEGSTGVSTGTHLHFEIRVNGKATDPRQFISGQP